MPDRGREVEIEREDERTEQSESTSQSTEEPVDDATGAAHLADELGRTDLRTTDEGYVEARVTDIEPVEEYVVRLTVELPTGERVPFRLEKPVPWSEEFLLARIVRHAGYDAASIDHLIGEEVLLDRGDPWTDREGVWDERIAGSTLDSYRGALAALGFDTLTESRPAWRLVDPGELDRTDEEPRLSTITKLLLATGLAALTLFALPIVALLTSLSGAAVVVIAALTVVCYIGIVTTVILGRLLR